ncbi:hypothetical protein, partial [Desulfovibrio sp.]|uniref:hypothetical protein n=1 Tax=Desulfovibrio sp. TaxID=885 RepID=UPI0025C3985B
LHLALNRADLETLAGGSTRFRQTAPNLGPFLPPFHPSACLLASVPGFKRGDPLDAAGRTQAIFLLAA